MEQSLKSVSYQSVLDGNSATLQHILEACDNDGAFELDIHDVEGLEEMVQQMYHLSATLHELPDEYKMQWEMDRWSELQIAGYKRAGKHSGVSEGRKDGFENFLIPFDALMHADDSNIQWPLAVATHMELMQNFERQCQEIGLRLLAALSDAVGIQIATDRFESAHRRDEPSTTSMALLKYLPTKIETKDVGHMAHTDVGSLTVLYTVSPGLEVYREKTDTWMPVTPKPGCVIVNVGDTLRFLSGGRFCSCLHRVVPIPDSSGWTRTRFSIAFFLRPELEARFHDEHGQEWTGEGWQKAKYRIFRADSKEQKQTTLLTGKRGFLGGWNGSSQTQTAV